MSDSFCLAPSSVIRRDVISIRPKCLPSCLCSCARPSGLLEDGIPLGWGKSKLSDVADVNLASFKAKELPEEINYIDISSVSPGLVSGKKKYSAEDSPGRARRKVSHGDVIWSGVHAPNAVRGC